jgi:hypothetical protein
MGQDCFSRSTRLHGITSQETVEVWDCGRWGDVTAVTKSVKFKEDKGQTLLHGFRTSEVKSVKLILLLLLLLLLFPFTANWFLPGGSGTAIRTNTQITHITLKGSTAHTHTQLIQCKYN